MKKISLMVLVFTLAFVLTACSDLCVGTACITDNGEEPSEVDTTDPVITITEQKFVAHVGESFNLGCTATDDTDGTITCNTTGTVDTNTVGPYLVTYDATDAAGNSASFNVYYVVIPEQPTEGDTTDPEITITEDTFVAYVGESFNLGCTATDDTDGTVTCNTYGTVDTNTVGPYLVTYEATDTAGNSATISAYYVVIPEEPTGSTVENMIVYPHINGHGVIKEDQVGFVLFEEEMLGYVKYQVTYLSCTCRNSDVNYWQVMYIEISTTDNSIRRISFDADKESGAHTYTAGMWGDSSPTPGPSGNYSDGKYYQDFVDDFFPWLVGQTPESLDGITVFTNENYHGVQNTKTIDEQNLIDDFAGSSVSTNNMIRVIHAMFDYHIENYD